MDKSLTIMENTGETLQLPIGDDADAAFEPTVDDIMDELMDDETTLIEEEEIAALENDTNPLDEIAALKAESELPIDQILAKYGALPTAAQAGPPRKKLKKTVKNQARMKHAQTGEPSITSEEQTVDEITETLTQKKHEAEQSNGVDEDVDEVLSASDVISSIDDAVTSFNKQGTEGKGYDVIKTLEKKKIRRSHLFELYPEQNFDNAIKASSYSDDEDIEEEGDESPNYANKIIGVGEKHQADIPGISQYGDILPYENEDKLVWEPCQVSEAEVEEYLLKIREIKSNLTDGILENATDDKNENIKNDVVAKAASIETTTSGKQNEDVQMKQLNSIADTDSSTVVKDNEQALHLLVQCGYDFKEALRRKRLNAVPLTGGTMSIWSEEECQKFEEGIQKFGKDFFKIRQHQVRTRTMRELVLFYYLWKKSERRDRNFANADTVDHMDLYLNEGEDYGSNSGGTTVVTTASTLPTGRKVNGSAQNSFSIMLGNQTSVGNQIASPTKMNSIASGSHSRKRTSSDASGNSLHSSGTILAHSK